MDSIDFESLMGELSGGKDGEGDINEEELSELFQSRTARDPRIVRSIESVAMDAEARMSRPSCYDGDPEEAECGLSDDEIFSPHESELEGLWPQWGERRCAQLGRGIPAGVEVTPQHLPRTASSARPLSYK